MSWIDTGVIASALVILVLASAGFFSWRSGSRTGLHGGPFWYWAWAILLTIGATADLERPAWLATNAPPILSPVFSAFLIAGALRYCGRQVPWRLSTAALAVGCARAFAEVNGAFALSSAISLAVEPAAALVAGWIVHREASARGASWLHRVMPLGFVAVAIVETVGASQGLLDGGRLVLWPLWLAAGVPLIGLQVITGMERADRAEDESLRDRQDRRSANARLQLVAENIHEVIAEWSASGELLWMSDSGRDALGADPAALVGRAYAEVLRELNSQELNEEESAAVLGSMAPSRPGSVSGQPSTVHVVHRRDGAAPRYFETRIAREPGPAHEARTLAFSRDITDRVVAHRAIRRSEERFRKFSLLSADYCFVSTGVMDDPHAPVENWMTGALEEITGYTHEELQRIGFQGFLHPDDVSAGRERVIGLMRRGGESSHEFRIVTKGGETRYIAENLLIERDGTRFTIYGAARDISDERELERGLASAQKLESLGLLAGGIAHDFNNLLMVILGNTELALDAVRESGEVRRDLEGVVEAVDQARTLTQQLLAYAGRGAVQQIPVDLSERVRSVSELLAVAGAAEVALDLDLKEGLPAVVADPGEIQQLAMNLVLNAIEACEGAGHVQVVARSMELAEQMEGHWIVGEPRPDQRYVVLEVTDDGVGMDPETLARVFDPFFTTKTAGRGLGLAAVIGIVRSIDGAMRVVSEQGKGTGFTLLLPASSERASIAQVGPLAESVVAGRILVVDDDERVRRVAVRMLRARGFEVSTADSGAEAVAACERTAFDVILLDAVMPGMTGAETFAALRKVRPDVPVLMVSGFDMDRAAGDLLEQGLAGFIGKPFRAKDLLEAISAIVADAP